MNVHVVSVRALAEWACARGGIMQAAGARRLREGREGHEAIQSLFPSDWRIEAPVSMDVPFENVILRIQGRADALLMAEISGEGFFDRTWFFEGRPQDCAFPETKPVVAAATADSLTIRAEKYIHALVLDGDCVFDDNFFSMLPGEERTVRFVREKAGEIEMRVLGSKEPSVVVRV